MLAENVLASLLDLECASGNDTRHSNSEIRIGARVLPNMMAGTDFICSGFGSIADYDNSFASSSFNADEFEDFLALQRDFLVDGGLSHVPEDVVMTLRARAIDAMAAVLDELGLATVGPEQKTSILHAHGSADTTTFSLGEVARINQAMADRDITLADIVRALAARGFDTEAENLMVMARQRVAGDYLQTSAIIRDGKVISAVNHPNDYSGPQTGYQIDDERRAGLSRMRGDVRRADVLALEDRIADDEHRIYRLTGRGTAIAGDDPAEVVIAISPGFGAELHKTTGGCRHSDVLRALTEGIREGGGHPRIVRVRHTADTSFVGLTGARLAGSGIAVGIQGKGTTVIHKAGLAPHTNLELFPQAPLITLEHYHAIGRNAAVFAKVLTPEPVVIPHYSGALNATFHVITALLYHIEADLAYPDSEPEEIDIAFLD
jgi:propanediol dehydratase large subunit